MTSDDLSHTIYFVKYQSFRVSLDMVERDDTGNDMYEVHYREIQQGSWNVTEMECESHSHYCEVDIEGLSSGTCYATQVRRLDEQKNLLSVSYEKRVPTESTSEYSRYFNNVECSQVEFVIHSVFWQLYYERC